MKGKPLHWNVVTLSSKFCTIMTDVWLLGCCENVVTSWSLRSDVGLKCCLGLRVLWEYVHVCGVCECAYVCMWGM